MVSGSVPSGISVPALAPEVMTRWRAVDVVAFARDGTAPELAPDGIDEMGGGCTPGCGDLGGAAAAEAYGDCGNGDPPAAPVSSRSFRTRWPKRSERSA